MSHAAEAVLLSLLAGSAILLGALLGIVEARLPRRIDAELSRFLVAVGGGALLAAVALVLLPEGMEQQPLPLIAAAFLAGGLSGLAIDRLFGASEGAAGQVAAMLLDFIPETIVIGAIIATDRSKALFMAVIIFIQNIPESFAAFRELRRTTDLASLRIVLLFAASAARFMS